MHKKIKCNDAKTGIMAHNFFNSFLLKPWLLNIVQAAVYTFFSAILNKVPYNIGGSGSGTGYWLSQS